MTNKLDPRDQEWLDRMNAQMKWDRWDRLKERAIQVVLIGAALYFFQHEIWASAIASCH
jgi:hypothetical protein